MKTPLGYLTALAVLFWAPAAFGLTFNGEVRDTANGWVYGCGACTQQQFADLVAPAGYAKGNANFLVPDSLTNVPPVPPAGVPAGLDIVAEIPGDEYQLIARLLSNQVIEFQPPPFGPMVLSQVQRETTFTYAAGSVVHELSDPQGNTYVLFTISVAQSPNYDLTQLDALDGIPIPTGWGYSSRLLAQDFVVESNGIATVFSSGLDANWQLVPEPGTLPLLLAGFAAALSKARGGKTRVRRRSESCP